MGPTSTSVENKIIDAAIACVDRYGIQGTTNRKIAAIAGVNSAAINYYFRSKEALVQKVMQVTLHNAFDRSEIEAVPEGPAKERAYAVFIHLLEGGVNFPGITRAHFYDLIANGNSASPVVEKFSDFIGYLIDDLQAHGAELSREELQLACLQISTSVVMMVLTPRLFETKFGFSMEDESSRQVYLRRLIDKLL
jgi:AcrR family transcriptional regulator